MEGDSPTLPIEGPIEISEVEMSHGSFGSVIEVKGRNIAAKINRLLKGNEMGKDVPQSLLVAEYLVNRGTGGTTDVVAGLSKWAKEKKRIQGVLERYLGSHTTKLLGMVITESPRAEIEKRLPSRMASRTKLERIPKAEIALVEFYEKVDTENELDNIGLKRLDELKENERFNEELADFANATLDLLVNERMTIDIADRAGIRGYDKSGDKVALKKLEPVLRFLEGSVTSASLFPRNVTYDNGRIVYFDNYPVGIVPESFSDRTNALISAVSRSDGDSVRQIVGKSGNEADTEREVIILRYLVLLKSMGADLERYVS